MERLPPLAMGVAVHCVGRPACAWQAKGLEWGHVFVPGVHEGSLPIMSKHPPNTPEFVDALEEARRRHTPLPRRTHVHMTRAQLSSEALYHSFQSATRDCPRLSSSFVN